MIDNKIPRGIVPRHCSPSPQGAKYVTVNQDNASVDRKFVWPSENRESEANDHEKTRPQRH